MCGANFFDGGYIFGQADAMIEIQGGVIIEISQDLISIEVNEDGIFLYFEAIDFEESRTVLLSIFRFLLHPTHTKLC